jgi:hypothetical protein
VGKGFCNAIFIFWKNSWKLIGCYKVFYPENKIVVSTIPVCCYFSWELLY